MSASRLDIWNMALSHLGISYEVNNENESSKEAQACRRFYEQDREFTLRDFEWPFANVFEVLQSVVNPSPEIEWQYAYRYPANALAVRRLLNGFGRVETPVARIKYRIGRDSAGKVLFSDVTSTDAVPLYVKYTYNETETARFDPDFVYALSLKLAVSIGPRVANDRTKLRMDAHLLYLAYIAKAKANAANEESADLPDEGDLVRARG